MTIPKKLKLVSREIETVYDRNRMAEENLLGQARFNQDKIFIAPENKNLSRTSVEVTYLHEVLHFCNNILHREEEDNEQYVSSLSELLHSVITQIITETLKEVKNNEKNSSCL